MSYSPPSGDTVDLIFLEDYIPPEGDAVDLIFGTTIDITYAHIETYLSQDFSLLFDKETYCDQIYGLRLGASLDQPFFDQRAQAVICLANADAQAGRQIPLTDLRLFGEQFQ